MNTDYAGFMPKKGLIISFSKIERDPRVLREIGFLQDNYELTIAGYGPYSSPKIEFIDLTLLSLHKKHPLSHFLYRLGRAKQYFINGYEKYYWSHPLIVSAEEKLSDKEFDFILANDIFSLPLAHKIAQKTNAKLVFDAHEYSPREYENYLIWRIINQPMVVYFCKKYLALTDAMVTVCDGIAEEYQRVFGIEKPKVITNAPDYIAHIQPSPTKEKQIRIIHHGGAARDRHIEDMIEIVMQLDERFSLDLMLVASDEKYLNELKLKAGNSAKIRFLEPVPFDEIIFVLKDYDIGLYLLAPTNFNNQMALPNKLFEFIQARLAVIIGPSPEMARIVQNYQCGCVSTDFSIASMVRLMNGLSHENIVKFKKMSELASKELNSQNNNEVLNGIIQNLIFPS